MNRIAVTSPSETETDRTGPLLFTNQQSVAKGKVTAITLTGAHLLGAGITSQAADISISAAPVINSNGTVITFSVDVPAKPVESSTTMELTTQSQPGQEFVVGGYVPSHLGVDSFVVGVYRGEDLSYGARVRAGFIPETRLKVFEAIKHLMTPYARS